MFLSLELSKQFCKKLKTLSQRKMTYTPQYVLDELNSPLHSQNYRLQQKHQCGNNQAADLTEAELCPGNQDDIYHTNINATVNLQSTLNSQLFNTYSTETLTTKMMSSTMINSTGLKRQPANTNLTHIETAKRYQIERRGSMSSYLIETECSCHFNNVSSSTRNDSSVLASLVPAMTNSTGTVNSVFGDRMSSTKIGECVHAKPSFFHSTLRSTVSKSSTEARCKVRTEAKVFGLLKGCVWKRSVKKNKSSVEKTKNYRFKMVHGKLSGDKKATKQRRLPRTSSFNSNEDEKDCDLCDFDLESEASKGVMAQESFRVESDSGFNNIGDFFVWYV